MKAESIRRPAVAGAFYPAEETTLRREVKKYLSKVPRPTIKGNIVAAMAPHAGYRFSASVAAHTYQAIRDIEVDTIVIIGHDCHARGIIAILSGVDAFDTPLGRVRVDTDMVKALAESDKRIIVHDGIHRRDHTVEVQLPFLQTILPDCKIVPVLFGEPSVEHCRAFAQAIRRAGKGKRIFILASTDLSHYPRYDDAKALDAVTMAKVRAMDVEALFAHLDKARKEGAARGIETAMCASGGVGTALFFAKAEGAAHVQVLDQANSGDVPGGDKNRVVGYASAVFIIPENGLRAETAKNDNGDAAAFTLDEAVQKELLTLARKRIRTALSKTNLDYRLPPELKSSLDIPSAVFVTLHEHGRLRGCIGMTEARLPLWKAVSDMAFSAAFRDWRFSPVSQRELDDIRIEISVLSPLKKVDGPDAIIPKVHGVVVRQGGHRGIFLPQVWEQLPDKNRFLSLLCSEKAGLPADAWKDPKTDLLVFTVFAFEEP